MRGEIYVILANLLFASMGIFTRILNKELLPITQVAYRLMLAAAIFFIIFSVKGERQYLKTSKKNIVLLFIAGFIGYGLMVVFIALSYINTSYGNTVTFVQLAPVFVMVLGLVFLHEKITLNSIAAIALSLLGILLVFKPDFSNLDKGIVFALISAGFSSFYYIIVRKLKDVDIRTRLFYLAFFGGFFLFPLVLVFESPLKISFSSMTLFSLILMAALNVVAYFLLNIGLKTISANVTSILGVSQAFFGIIIGLLIYQEKISLLEFFGLSMIILALIVLNIDTLKTKHKTGDQ